MAARLKIVILERTDADTYRYVMWADVPAARQRFLANPTATSAWLDATAGDLDAIRTGAVVERVATTNLKPGQTQNQKLAALVAEQARFQAEVNSKNPWSDYGSTYNGTSWTAGGVA